MPELPEIEALATFLRERAVGRTVARTDVAAISAVKTFDPPLSMIAGAYVVDAGRHGKFLDLMLASEAAGEGLPLVVPPPRGRLVAVARVAAAGAAAAGREG